MAEGITIGIFAGVFAGLILELFRFVRRLWDRQEQIKYLSEVHITGDRVYS